MEFIKAGQLKEIFEVQGSFYDLVVHDQSFECRNYAKVYRKDSKFQVFYDAIVVLTNPGLCAPQQYTYNIPQITIGETEMNYTLANTDNTQYQIMRIMQYKRWNKVLLINLSDLRAGNIAKFKQKLSAAQAVGFESHSIFTNQRKKELDDVLDLCDGPIILAWGTNGRIKNLAERAFASLPHDKIIGFEHKKTPFYYHASPTPVAGKIKWLEQMNGLIS